MEIEIRQRDTAEVGLSLQRHAFGGADRKGDIAAFSALELLRLERLYIIDGVSEPLLQFIERLFGVGRRRHLSAGEASAGLAGKIAGNLNLARQRQHVRIEPGAEQYFGRNIFRFAVRLGLVEDACKTAENLQESRNGRVVKGHGRLFSCCGISFGAEKDPSSSPACGKRIGVRGTIREAGIN